jgi:hypothetical protein
MIGTEESFETCLRFLERIKSDIGEPVTELLYNTAVEIADAKRRTAQKDSHASGKKIQNTDKDIIAAYATIEESCKNFYEQVKAQRDNSGKTR